jgi:uncharacterized membrane protein YiaA
MKYIAGRYGDRYENLSKTVAKLLFVVGALVLSGWAMDLMPRLLSGKGYFLGVLMTATFGNMHIFAQKTRATG